MELLKQLTECPGPSGREEKVRELIIKSLKGVCNDFKVDDLGNLICHMPPAKTTAKTKRIMIASHMDEIGFYVRRIDDKGFIRIHQVGGFDTRNLFARRVLVHGTKELVGNLNPASKPVHIASAEERKHIPEVREFAVDLGLPVDEVKKMVNPGDPVTLLQETVQLGNYVSGKCMDDRAACWVQIRAMQAIAKKKSPHDLYFVFTVQEEVGLRGSTVSAYDVQPEISIALDVTLAVDVPGVPPEDGIAEMGKGIAIKIMDSASISNHELFKEFIKLAGTKKIQYQYELLPMGGTDAGAMQRARSGSKAITLSIPCRYVHTVIETVKISDMQAGVDLLLAYCEK